MANNSYGQFTECTSLIDFQRTQKMVLRWILPTSGTSNIERIELYRYIGNANTCINPSNITEDLSKLIYKVEQGFNGLGEPDNTIIINTYFPYASTTIESKNIIDLDQSFIDDFSILNISKYDLDTYQGLSGLTNNGTIIDQIKYTERVLYYILKIYARGVQSTEAASYFITTSVEDTAIISHSTKTQVRHDYLHFEGDEIWRAKTSAEIQISDNSCIVSIFGGEIVYTYSGGLCRTAIDLNPLFEKQENIHIGSYGRGGTVWLTDKISGKVMQHNLRDGTPYRVYNTNKRGGNPIGIGINQNTGSVVVAPGTYGGGVLLSPSAYYCDINKTTVDYITGISNFSSCDEIVSCTNYPDRLFLSNGSTISYAMGHIMRLGSTIQNSTFIPTTISTVLSSIGGGIASCPNGYIASLDTSEKLSLVNPENAITMVKLISNPSFSMSFAGTIGVDRYNLYPNTIINTEGDADYFCLNSRNEISLYAPRTTDINQIDVNWQISLPANITGFSNYDSENNGWYFQSYTAWSPNASGIYTGETKKIKLYRTAGDWYDNDDVDDRYIYPYGGYSRYPSVEIDEWPSSLTNIREIEWFLTRNSGVSTYRADLVPSLGYRNTIVDASTLDNNTAVSWDPVRPALLYTAASAWESMVERKMLRPSKANISSMQTATELKYYTASITPFYSYSTPGVKNTNSVKYGVRINVSDIRTANGNPGKDLDDFYDNYSAIWKPIVIARIRAWANAFASDSTSYIGVSGRVAKITNNKTGQLVHPFYKYATYATTSYYLNSSLSSDIQSKIRTYIGNLVYYDFSSTINRTTCLGNNFIGNNYTDDSQSVLLNQSSIHPEPVNPSISLFISGYQSNPGYQDTPAYCYNWKNTIPTSLSAMVTSMTGYDDCNITYLISSQSGSYNIASYSLSTGNIDVYSITNNQSGMIYKDYIYNNPGNYTAQVRATVTDLYDYITVSCNVINISANAGISVLERCPESKFFIEATDDATARRNAFCNNRWGG